MELLLLSYDERHSEEMRDASPEDKQVPDEMSITEP
jgi:hypothetical protein